MREVARRLGISRNTVRRYLRSETIEPAHSERLSTCATDKYTFQLASVGALSEHFPDMMARAGH
ncbi:helix-turn-helix domain-containing protein [Janthinobacterium lividum]|uniref:helix-turn-helix domain-containing protein n=1 Tax=Janthinobacterium lividum TaxID=29581 RepID=UPI003D15F3D9